MKQNVLGFEKFYEISECATLYSKRRKIGIPMKTLIRRNYYSVGLYDGKRYHTFQLHRIVFEAFKGKIPKGMQINHIDGNKLNNNLSNLELCTPKENIAHAIRTGLRTRLKSENAYGVKLNKQKVEKIRALFKKGYSLQKLSDMFDVSKSNVGYIVRYKIWK